MLAPFGRRLLPGELDEPVGRLPHGRGRGPGGTRAACRPVLHACRERGLGVGGRRRAALPGPRVLGLPGARRRGSSSCWRRSARAPSAWRDSEAGDGLWVLGPLGIGFSHSPRADAGAPPLLVGGGIGVAPLVIWAEGFAEAGVDAARAARLPLRPPRRGRRAVRRRLAARDRRRPAPAGINDVPARDRAARARAGRPSRPVYACGPPRDAGGGAADLRRARVPAQLAMEGAMACGFGACFGCVVQTRAGLQAAVRGRPGGRRGGARRGWEHDESRPSMRRGRRVSDVDLAGLRLDHPVLNGSGTFDAIAALRTFGHELRERASRSPRSSRRRSRSRRGAATRRRGCGRPRPA